MKETTGDLIQLAKDAHFDVIIHGCNCQCAMGAGIAKTIKAEFPEAYKADLATQKSDRTKLGTISFASVAHEGHEITIVNAYTQFHWKGSGVKVNYEAIKNCFHTIRQKFAGKRIGYPLIGAGLAGGNWDIISEIIDSELKDEDHTLVKFKP